MALVFGRQGTSTSVYDPEFTTSVHLTRRTLDVTDNVYNFGGKGSAIGDKEFSDEEWAFRIQSEYLAKALQLIEDARIAKLLDEGAEANHPSLSVAPIEVETLQIPNDNIYTTPQPIVPDSPIKDFTKSVSNFTTTGIFEEFLDSPGASRSLSPQPSDFGSQRDALVSVQDNIYNIDEVIQIDKGKKRVISNESVTPNRSRTPFLDEALSQDDEDSSEVLEEKRNGKNPINDPIISADEAYALKVQADDLHAAFQVMEDAQLARTLDEGAEAKHPSSQLPSSTNQVAIALRQAALSVAAKNGLPGPSSLPHEHEPSLTPSLSLDSSYHLPMADSTLNKVFVSRFLTPEHVSGLGIASDLLYPCTQRPKSPTKSVVATPEQEEVSPVPSVVPPPQVLCIICKDPVISTDATHTSCGHDYCKDCIVNYVDASTRDNSLLPVRCCNVPIPREAIVPFLTNTLLSFFEDKSRELEVPVNHRIYCQSPDCSRFLGSSQRLEGNIACPKCGSSTCASCKQPSHIGESCSDNAGILEVKALARVEHWQTCPGCNAIVELQQGCYHMTCRCATQFCYLCAALWKGCNCPQWEERRL